MDHLSAQPLGCQLLDIYQQIHISLTHTHTYTRRERTHTLSHRVGPHYGRRKPTAAQTERLLTFDSSTHFFCRVFSNEEHEIDPCKLRQIDPSLP